MKFLNLLIIILMIFIFLPKPAFANHQNGCLSAGFWVEDSVYNFFNPAQNPNSQNTFEQWANMQMVEWNRIIFDSGGRDCFLMNNIVRVSDGALPLSGGGTQADDRDRSVDVQWGFKATSLSDMNFMNSILNTVDYGLLHELSHARYLIDNYALSVYASIDPNSRDQVYVTDSQGILVVRNYFPPIDGGNLIYNNKSQDLMGAGDHFYAPHSIGALNLIAGQHTAEQYGNWNAPGNLGVYLNDLPANNILRILDAHSQPISGAQIKIFQSIPGNHGLYSKLIDNIPDITGTTDSGGNVSLGSNPFGFTAGMPFYYLWPRLVLLMEVSYQNQQDYKFLEVSDFNLAYWAGATNQATYDIVTTINSPTPTPIPTPNPQVCTRANPQVSIIPFSQIGYPGQTLPYTVAVTNSDSTACSPSAFSITFSHPISQCTGSWYQTPNPGSITLSPGQSGSIPVAVTSSIYSPLIPCDIFETATNTADPSYYGYSIARYEVSLTPSPTPTPIGNIGVGPTTPLSPGACSVNTKANSSDGPITIAAGNSAALSWTSSGDIDGSLGGLGPNGNQFSGKTLLANGTDTTGVLSSGTYTFGVSCQGTNLVVNSDYVTINVISGATPIPTATPTQTPLATPVPTLSPISCGSSYTCKNNVTGNICGVTSIFANACSLNAPCDCGGAGTITQCLNSGVNCAGAPVTPTPAPICPYGVDHYSISVFCSSFNGGSSGFSTDNPSECSNYPVGGNCCGLLRSCNVGEPYDTLTKCTISPVCATQPSPSPTVTPAPAKVVTGITINGLAVNLASPTLNLHLPGTAGVAQVITVPMVVTYSDNTTSTSTLTFNYVPPAPTPTVVPTVAPTNSPTLTPSPSATPIISTPAPAGPDTTPPTASITSPGSGATVKGTTAINVDATDNVGMQKVEFRIDNTLLINDKTAPFTANWNTTTYTNGSHTILVRAYDLANNRKEAVVTVNISN